MTNKKISFISILFSLVMILFCITGCSNTSTSSNSKNDKIITNDEHLINVLKGKEKYKYSSEEYDGIVYSNDINVGLDFYINETHYISEGITDSLITDYAFVDLDGDSKNEIIANINNSYGFVLILHHENNINYGYILSIRAFNTVKENGEFLSSSSATNTTIHQAEFIDEMLNIKTIAYSDYEGFFDKDDKEITEQEFNELLDKFNDNTDVKYAPLEN